MKSLTQDERGFIEGIASYIKSDARARGAVPKVKSLLAKVTASAKKEQSAQIISTVLLTDAEKKRIESILNKLLGHTVECHYSIDKSLIAGIKIQVADWIVDSSIITQVATMTRSIISV